MSFVMATMPLRKPSCFDIVRNDLPSLYSCGGIGPARFPGECYASMDDRATALGSKRSTQVFEHYPARPVKEPIS